MRKVTVGLLSLSLASGFGLMFGPNAIASPPVDAPPAAAPVKKADIGDDLPNQLEDKRRALRQEALDLVLSGKAKPEKREKQLAKATDKLLKDFPPGAKK